MNKFSLSVYNVLSAANRETMMWVVSQFVADQTSLRSDRQIGGREVTSMMDRWLQMHMYIGQSCQNLVNF